jgi:hypothetical protein
MFILKKDKELILEMVDNIINNPNCNDVARGELLTILAYLKVKDKNYIYPLSLFKEAEKLLFNYNDTEMNIFIYHGLSIIYEHSNDTQNAKLYQAKLNKMLKQKPYYKRYIYNDKTAFNT